MKSYFDSSDQVDVKVMASVIPLVQDHVILLLSTPDFENPPAWLADNFNIVEGGTHTFQPSRNKLIFFSDGTYLELFNWISEPPNSNAWADRSAGLIDFAMTSMPPSTPETLHSEVSTRLASKSDDSPVDFRYTEPEAGGRMRKDGVHVQWKLMRPMPIPNIPSSSSSFKNSGSGHRKDLPFFTHDVTPRNVRVQFDNKEQTTHPCGATGITAVEVTFPQGQYEEYVKLYGKLLGVRGKPNGVPPDYHSFGVRSPVEGSVPATRILMFGAGDGGEETGRGCVRGLRLYAEGREGHGLQTLGKDGIAKTVSLEW